MAILTNEAEGAAPNMLRAVPERRLVRTHVIAGLILVMAASACGGDDDSHACTAEARPAVNVTVLAPDGNNAVGATVSIVTASGERRPCAEPVGAEGPVACYDQAGPKLVEARQGDLVGQAQVSVPWSADGCQPVPQSVVIELGG